MSWWEKEYCAKRMKLVVIGKDSIETLEKWVKEKFEAVPISTEGAPAVGPNGQRVVFEDSPTNPDRMGVSFVNKNEEQALMIDGHLCQACEG
jgi:insulysin